VARLVADRHLRLEVSEEAQAALIEEGYDPVYGARPLKRAIQQQLENPLAQEILAGRFRPGQVIQVDLKEGQLVFSEQGAQASAA